MTGREVFEAALALINERDSRGEYHSDVSDYEENTPRLISLIVARVWGDDCLVRGIPVNHSSWTAERITSLDTPLPLHEAVCATLPYLLACLLILEEDRDRSEYFQGLYVEARRELIRNFSSAKRKSITDVYF